MASEIEELRARVARLEAREAVMSAFNRYLYSLDTGFGDDILDCYTEDAVLDVPNFPGADGRDLRFRGRDEIAKLYAPYAERESRIGGGHHAANVAIDVAPDLQTAKLSAYFMTSTAKGVQGGRYEGVLRAGPDGHWRFATLVITSAWGWRARDVDTVSESVGLEHSPFGGRHAAYTPSV